MNAFRIAFFILLVGQLASIIYPAHAQSPSNLRLACGPSEKSNLYVLDIMLSKGTFNIYLDGSIMETFDEPLVQVTRERIIFYESYGARPMYLDRIAGTFSIARYTYPCVRSGTETIRQPKF